MWAAEVVHLSVTITLGTVWDKRKFNSSRSSSPDDTNGGRKPPQQKMEATGNDEGGAMPRDNVEVPGPREGPTHTNTQDPARGTYTGNVLESYASVNRV